MSSNERSVIRFAVGSPKNIQSWVWRMWVQGDEVYLGTRSTLTVFKVSLHKSNIWRIAFVSDLKREDEKSDRVIVRWQRPGEFAPGWTPSIGVLISSIEAKHPFKKINIDDSRIRWFKPPKKGNKLLFKILFSKPGINESGLKLILTPTDQLAGKLSKKNGETVWLIIREDVLTTIETKKIVDVMEKTKVHLKENSSEDTITDSRALLVVSEDIPTITNQPTIIDIELGKENLDIPNS